MPVQQHKCSGTAISMASMDCTRDFKFTHSEKRTHPSLFKEKFTSDIPKLPFTPPILLRVRSLPAMPTHPEIGQTAPDFTAPVIGGDYPSPTDLTLSSLRGQTVVLYFYPKDDTPGCTKQACALRDGWAQIKKKARVFGVSTDSVKSHEKFIKKHDLPFPLISDEKQEIVTAYGVWVEKSMYGKKYMGTERTTVIISPDGKVKKVLPKVKPEEHFDLVMAEL
jgi:peroxiredoxin Q/BCP